MVVAGRTLNRTLCSLSLMLVIVALVPLAYADPPDAVWIAGIYDAGDHDDVVSLIIDTQMVDQLAQPALAGLPAPLDSVLGTTILVARLVAASVFHLRSPPVV